MVSTASHDDELLARFAGGDPDAFVAFYGRHLPAVLAFFLRRTGDRELTADLTAEVFAAALLAAERYRPSERPALAWLYGIAAHKLADSRRRGRVEELASAGAGEAETALSALSPDLRDAVTARVLDERPYAEIAGELHCSELLVRQRVSRGLRALRAQMRPMKES